MKARLLGAGIVLAFTFTGSVWGADFDGSKALICATVEGNDCAPGEVCEPGTPSEIGAPAFLRVNIDKKQIVGPKRTTPIQVIETSPEQILMLGTELDLAWSMALDRETGAFALTFVNAEGAFVVFGSCAVP